MYGDFQNFRNFNSHAHVERDKISLSPTSVQKISTHTLTWSVTIVALKVTVKVIYFNSHAHVERDLMISGTPTPTIFQLTRSRGA